MTNLTMRPMIDDFDTTLAQARDGATGTVYLNSVPSFTFPSNTTTSIVVNPGKDNMQVAIIDSINTSAKTVNVSSISVNKGAGVAYTQQSHSVGSVVRISDSYTFWEAIKTAINTKIDGRTQGVYFYADATARNADLGATPATNGLIAGLTSEGKITYSLGGSWLDWSTDSATFVNATDTQAGKVENATTAEGIAGTGTGGTGALLFMTPAQIASQIQSGTRIHADSTNVNDTYTATVVPAPTAYTKGMMVVLTTDTANTGACSLNLNSLGAKDIKDMYGNDLANGVIRANDGTTDGACILVYNGTFFVHMGSNFASETWKGLVEKATDAEVETGSDTERYITPKQAKDNYETLVNVVSGTRNSSGNEDIAHGLSRVPKMVYAYYSDGNVVGYGFYAGSVQWSAYVANSGQSASTTELISTSTGNDAVVTGLDATNLSVTWTDNGDTTTYRLVFIA